MALTDDQIELYSRQIILRELGGVGQTRLLEGRILLEGAGTALDCAATYLVGAGVGTVHVATSRDAGAPAFAPLAERNPDAAVGPGPDRPRDLSTYDVLLATGTPSDARERACLGELSVGEDAVGIHLDVVPAGAGCLACCAPSPSSLDRPAADSPHRTADEVDAAQAGSMAALAALLWLAGIREDPGPKRLTLTRGAAIWEETPLRRAPACPRACRS